ncbi:hypothetical protein [Mariniplasma anaerobium]|uniref:Uncharacterized protein n=1 Tax=Mariniplasma anaerobium TaxID=2735436 RepID=A0A7U9THX5_9MOLU|nr:hypothetical protein [Mariniplasma anaerobium]BCR35173.1 hypothetical protein MPAN_000660 [Mariniplasma anaerobium]
MSIHYYRIYYRKNNKELWTKIYEDNFDSNNYIDNRKKVISALEESCFEYKIIDKFEGVTYENNYITEQNKSSLFDGLQNFEFSEINVNVALNYLFSFKHFIRGDGFVKLDNLIFTKHSYDLIKVIKAYDRYTNETIFTQNEMNFFLKTIQNDYRLLVAYLFYEYIIDRIKEGRFSRYAKTEAKEFYSIEENRQLGIHKKTVLTTLINSAVKLYRSNQISVDSKINVLQYSDFFNMVKLTKVFNYTGFMVYNNNPKDQYYEIYKDVILTDEQKIALDFAMTQGSLIEKINVRNIDFKINQNLGRALNTNDENSVALSILKYDEQLKISRKKKKIIATLTPILVIFVAIISLVIAGKINEAKYTYISINSENYNTLITINPSIVETIYYTETSISPSKYIYSINLNTRYLTDYEVNPVLYINYTNSSGAIYKKLNSFSFESQTKIDDVVVSISPTYAENLKILKSDLESLKFSTNSTQEYELIIIQNDYHLEEMTLTLENYSSYLSITVDDPVDTLRSNVYQYTTYSIKINKKNCTETILNTSIIILYELSNNQFSSGGILHPVTFSFQNLTESDSFGRYPFYEYEIQSISGKIIARNYIPR